MIRGATPEMARDSARALVALLLLAASLVAVAVAPFAVGGSYSWVEHSISASGGQTVHHAWVTRLGFLLFGFSVLILAGSNRPRWGKAGQLLFGLFAVMMIATAAFAHSPYEEGLPYDHFEDDLHTVTATVMGFAFVIGALTVMARRGPPLGPAHAVDGGAAALALALSLAMAAAPDLEGLLQRVMFLVGYGWYGKEALRMGFPRILTVVHGGRPVG
ncbi:MAG: DUF998 domain-containing protein [Dehalococcoidia bacterium]